MNDSSIEYFLPTEQVASTAYLTDKFKPVFFEVGLDGNVISMENSCRNLLNISAEDFISGRWAQLLDAETSTLLKRIFENLGKEDSLSSAFFHYASENNRSKWIYLKLTHLNPHDKWMGVMIDVSFYYETMRTNNPFLDRTSPVESAESLILKNQDDLISDSENTRYFEKRLLGISFSLSPKEIQISEMIRRGMTNKEIAEEFNISPLTIHTHRNRIREKLGLRNKKINLANYLRSL